MYGMASGPVEQTTVKEPAMLMAEEAETLLSKTPLACEPPRKNPRSEADYVDASSSSKFSHRGRPMGGYSDSDIVTMLQSLQSEVDMMKNSIYASIKDKDSCLYENINDLARKSKRSESDPASGYIVTVARERGFHRLAYIVDSNSHICRRFIWLLLLLGSLGLLAYQLMDRVVLYQTFPSHISLETRYPEQLPFPAVTICNLNQFRLTKTVEHQAYTILHNLHHQRESADETSVLYQQGNSLNMTYATFLRDVAHKREDLINSCRWQGNECDWNNFTPVITDYGLCFMFRPSAGSRFVQRQGSYRGLSLVLNVEQYEYLLGPKSAVGVKVAIHDPDEIPSIQRYGINVPVGRHTAIGIKRIKHESLPHPHGSCREAKGRMRDSSSSSCFYDCRCKAISTNCECSMPFTFSRPGYLRPCLLRDFVSCVVKPIGKKDNCSSDCSMRCVRNEYDPVVSEAAMSTYGAESKVLQLRHKAPLEEKVRKAMDMYHRVDDVIYEYDKDMLAKLSERLNSRGTNTTILSGLLESYDQKEESSLKRLLEAFKKLNDSVRIHYTLFKQSSHTAFTLFVNHMDNILNEVLSMKVSLQEGEGIGSINQTLWNVLWKLDQLIDVNPQRLHSSDPMLSEITESVESFQKDLLQEYGQSYEEFRDKKAFYQRRTSRILNITGSMKKILIRQYYLIRNTTMILHQNEARAGHNIDKFFMDIKSLLENEMKTFNDELNSLSNSYVSDRAEILDFFQNLAEISGNFTKGLDGVKQDLSSLTSLSSELKDRLTSVRTELAKLRNDYLKQINNKSDLAHKFQNTGMGTAISSVQGSLQDILNSVNHLSSEGAKLANSVQPIADRIIAFGLMDREDVDLDLHWLTFEVLMEKVKAFIKDIRDNLQAISLYRGELKEYMRRTKVDEIFYRNNFLHLDLFFKDLSETVISQRPSYTLLDLICDVGGSMALYLGASVLTILELSDFMCKCCDMYCGKKR